MSKLYFLGDSTESQMLGLVIVSEGKTAVIDGGTLGDAEQLCELLQKVSSGRVDAWFFTHPHHDHIGAFSRIFELGESITVEDVYHKFPTIEELKECGARYSGEIELWEKVDDIFKQRLAGRVHSLEVGEEFQLGKVKITVLRVYNENIRANFINNSSAVLRIDGERASVLILGDLGKEGGDEVMKKCTLESLTTDYTQMAHHGQGGVRREFYEYIKPKRCIWPSPLWLWDNDAGEGFDTGPWLTVRTREWVSALGVTEHIVEKDGLQIIEI